MSKPRSRIYTRTRGGATRFYLDARDYADVGGGREALCVPGETLATTDEDLAEALAAKRLTELQRTRAAAQGRMVADLPPVTTLAAYVREHLIAKARAGAVTADWLEGTELRLTRAVEFFGADRDLSTITVADVRRWNEALTAQGLSGSTRRQHVYALSHVYRRAQGEGKVAPGYNPVAAMMDKPKANTGEARWLEVPEAALLLASARTYRPEREDIAIPFAFPLLAALLLTGGRPAEVLGLEVDDISLTRRTVTFRPNAWRRLKTATSRRVVPLWPQLAEILRAYFPERERRAGTLLFPSFRTGQEAMLTDCRKLLDAIGARVG